MEPDKINIDQEKQNSDKAMQINSSRLATKKKRKAQTCHVRTVKVQTNKLNKEQERHLNMLFTEAKWLRNFILSLKTWKEKSEYNTKSDSVLVLNKEQQYETRELLHLSSQMKQEVHKQILNDIVALSAKKKKGIKVGKLHFVGSVNSINLKQFGKTYDIIGKNKIRLQGLKKPIQVNGLEQILDTDEIANAKLVRKPSGFYFKITTYKNKEAKASQVNKPNVGIDFGVANDMTLDNGVVLQVKQPVNKRTKKAHKNLSRKKKGSRNRWRAQQELQLAYEKQNNIKHEIKVKIGSFFRKETNLLSIQDENIKGWHSGLFGKAIQQSSIGGIIAELKHSSRTLVVDRWEPTTKKCRICNHVNQHMTLDQRTFHCTECGHTENRDVHSAKNMRNLADEKTYNPEQKVCTERTSKPAELSASTIYDLLVANCKWISLKQEAPSL